MKTQRGLVFLLVLATMAVTACGGDEGGGAGGGGGGSGGDQPKLINGCTVYQDQTSDGSPRNLNWDLPLASSPARCMKIKAGQSVTWRGLFSFHPLKAQGGDAGNPISNGGSGDTHVVAFPATGTFGYVCTSHPSMTGAIFVAP